jgi:hypothetical protein
MSSSIPASYPPAPVGDQTWINLARERQSTAASQLAMDKLRGEGGAVRIDQQVLSKAGVASDAANVGATPSNGLYIWA